MKNNLPILLVAVSLGLTGCGGGDSGTTSANSSAATPSVTSQSRPSTITAKSVNMSAGGGITGDVMINGKPVNFAGQKTFTSGEQSDAKNLAFKISEVDNYNYNNDEPIILIDKPKLSKFEEQREFPIKVTNTGSVAIKNIIVKGLSDQMIDVTTDCEQSCSNKTLNPGESCNIAIAVHPTKPENIKQAFDIVAQDSQSDETATRKVSVNIPVNIRPYLLLTKKMLSKYGQDLAFTKPITINEINENFDPYFIMANTNKGAMFQGYYDNKLTGWTPYELEDNFNFENKVKYNSFKDIHVMGNNAWFVTQDNQLFSKTVHGDLGRITTNSGSEDGVKEINEIYRDVDIERLPFTGEIPIGNPAKNEKVTIVKSYSDNESGVVCGASSAGALYVSYDKETITNKYDHDTKPDVFAEDMHTKAVSCYQNNLYAGTDKGLLISEDKGATWTVPEALKGYEIKGVYAYADEKGKNVYAVTDDAVFSSTDNGKSWYFENLKLGDYTMIFFPTAIPDYTKLPNEGVIKTISNMPWDSYADILGISSLDINSENVKNAYDKLLLKVSSDKKPDGTNGEALSRVKTANELLTMRLNPIVVNETPEDVTK